MDIRKSASRVLALLVAAMGVTGCASAPSTQPARLSVISSPQLVMSGFEQTEIALHAADDAHAYAMHEMLGQRNDERLGALPGDRVASVEYLEVRQREYLRTVNGRPRDFSMTRSTSIKRGIVQ